MDLLKDLAIGIFGRTMIMNHFQTTSRGLNLDKEKTFSKKEKVSKMRKLSLRSCRAALSMRMHGKNFTAFTVKLILIEVKGLI
jgi:hypothetical protein